MMIFKILLLTAAALWLGYQVGKGIGYVKLMYAIAKVPKDRREGFLAEVAKMWATVDKAKP